MQIKTARKYFYTPITMAEMQSADQTLAPMLGCKD